MRLTSIYTTIRKRVGKKPIDQAKSSNSYHIYDACDVCPLSVYIDVVCNNNLEALVISGNPSEDVLLLTKSKLTIEFSELSGNTETKVITNLLRQMYLFQSQIQGLRICLTLIASDRYDNAKEYLTAQKIILKSPSTDSEMQVLLKLLEGKIKGKIIQFEQVKKKYDSMNQGSDEKPKSEYYTELLIAISKHIGFHLKKEKLTVSEFALYLKDFNRHVESLKTKSHGK